MSIPVVRLARRLELVSLLFSQQEMEFALGDGALPPQGTHQTPESIRRPVVWLAPRLELGSLLLSLQEMEFALCASTLPPLGSHRTLECLRRSLKFTIEKEDSRGDGKRTRMKGTPGVRLTRGVELGLLLSSHQEGVVIRWCSTSTRNSSNDPRT